MFLGNTTEQQHQTEASGNCSIYETNHFRVLSILLLIIVPVVVKLWCNPLPHRKKKQNKIETIAESCIRSQLILLLFWYKYTAITSSIKTRSGVEEKPLPHTILASNCSCSHFISKNPPTNFLSKRGAAWKKNCLVVLYIFMFVTFCVIFWQLNCYQFHQKSRRTEEKTFQHPVSSPFNSCLRTTVSFVDCCLYLVSVCSRSYYILTTQLLLI